MPIALRILSGFACWLNSSYLRDGSLMRNISESKPKLRLPIFSMFKKVVLQRTTGCLPPVTVTCMFCCYLRGYPLGYHLSISLMPCFQRCIEDASATKYGLLKFPGSEGSLIWRHTALISVHHATHECTIQAEDTRNNKSCGSGRAMKLCQIHTQEFDGETWCDEIPR